MVVADWELCGERPDTVKVILRWSVRMGLGRQSYGFSCGRLKKSQLARDATISRSAQQYLLDWLARPIDTSRNVSPLVLSTRTGAEQTEYIP